jgi:UDP-glucose 4-epimerase
MLILAEMPGHSTTAVVTGGAGFIGSHLVDRLLEDGQQRVVVLDNFTRGAVANLAAWRSDARLDVVEADIRDAVPVSAVIQGADVVYHLAAQPTIAGAPDNRDEVFSSNVVGTFNVLRAASQNGVRHVVFASSRQVYGEPISLPVDEESPLLAINSFGASKAAAEAYCRAFRRECGLAVSVLRFANVYGPRDVGRVIPRWVHSAQSGKQLLVYGGRQVLDFVWVAQVVEALTRAADNDEALPPINVASGTGTRLIDLARRIARLAEMPGHLRIQPARVAEVTRFIANVDRMRNLLEIEPPLDPLAHLPALLSPVAVPS